LFNCAAAIEKRKRRSKLLASALQKISQIRWYRFNTSVTLQVQYIGNGLSDRKLVKPERGDQADAVEGVGCEEPEV
jgi:hypothetical protein